ncbi:AI-2E family transporter [Phenylobacterium aquaticum]|uniref:AI-2E family transporter n=1 Tax=Phenylobacterium aquaticum TaxID=1763816 RepID=UPI0026EB13FF|nr:AI-2E family transporter [Phenylobacterium aquaticum]
MARPAATPSMIGPVGVVKVAVVVIATILTGFTLYALRRMLEPFVLALFLLIMVDGVARLLSARVPGFPKAAATPFAITLIVLGFALTIWITADNAAALAAQSATYTDHINAFLSRGAQRLGLNVTPTLAGLIEKLNPSRFAGVLAEAVSHFAEAAVFVLIYLGFLVASRRGFAAKASQLFLDADDYAEARRLFLRVRRGVEQYIWIQTLVGLLITALSAVLMTLTGLSHIPFWCLIIFLANYIPAVGAAIGVLFPALFGLVEVDGATRAVVLLVGLEAIHFLVSHVVQPRMQGKSLNLDPLVVLLALAFWSAMWGVTGAFLSTPLTVLAMAILAEFPGTRPLAVLLSGDGRPDADMAD